MHLKKKSPAFAMLVMAITALTACAGNNGSSVKSRSSFGAYLAARSATAENDLVAANAFYAKALKADPANATVREQAFTLAVLAGETPRANELAKLLTQEKEDHQLARLLLSLDALKRGDYAGSEREMSLAQKGPFVILVGTLIESWSMAGAGKQDLALAKFDSFGGRGQSAFDLFVVYHKALMLDFFGRKDEAGDAYRKAMDLSSSNSVRIVEAYASYLSRQGDADAARKVVENFRSVSPDNPIAKRDATLLDQGKALPPLVASASDGAAEVLYGLGGALSQDGGNIVSELYLRLAIYMRPDFDVARTLLADGYERKLRWKDAIASYNEIAPGSALYGNARIQTAFALVKLKKEDEAIRILERMASADPQAVEPVVAIGDIQRGKENYAAAAEQYSKALAIAGDNASKYWTIYYARGICYERLGQWPKAEEDLQLALKLSQDHPLVLNYLGYSWIEMGKNLDQALGMIEKAVEQRPTDGFIVDSLGWAHYQLGNYEDAVSYLERAVELEPNDSTINEHLGDALWKVGRVIEARFQWQHALDMKPEEKRLAPLRAKLEGGLEAEGKTTSRSESPNNGS